MAFLNRISTLFKANINHAITRAEDPERMLEQIIADMQEQLLGAKQQVASSIADEKRLQRQFLDEEEKAKEWDSRAALAVEKGNDNLAKQALARRKEQEQIAAEYKAQWEKQSQAVEHLKQTLRSLEQRIEEAKRKKGLLIARQKRSEAQQQIQETLVGMRDSSAFEAFERMNQKVDEIEAKADAAADMVATEDASLEEAFADLDKNDIDDELEALKAKLQQKPADEEPE